MKKLTDRHFDYVRKDIKEWYGLNPTVPQLKKYLKNEHELLTEIATQPYLRDGLDTSVREMVADVFAQKLVGTSWPVGSTPKRASKKFFQTLIEQAKKNKIKIRIDGYLEDGIDEYLY